MQSESDLDQLCVNTIRALSIDAIEAASSGHPGAPMGLAPVAYTLWTRFLRHNPNDPTWQARDRFVLSAGHASMLLYSLLYLTGYDLSLDDIREFRQLGSKTPGHPEYGVVPGVEVTTGPLGQGVGNAVGMALAREIMKARFDRPGFDLADYYVYAICSDGDMMEGVASEACSLAGHLGLGHLVLLYDDNRITIEGSTSLSFDEDVGGRFEAYGWFVSRVSDANDIESVQQAIERAREEEARPSLVMIRSTLACGSPGLEGSEKAHGAPLGHEESCLTKKNLGLPDDRQFYVPREVLNFMRTALERGDELQRRWEDRFESYREEYPQLASDYERVMAKDLPDGWEVHLPVFRAGEKVATRAASGKVLQALAPVMWELIGGSADLGPSNKTYVPGYGSVVKGDLGGRNIHFGVREHGMGAILNGMAAHGGLVPYGGTFLVFSDYMRPSIRLASMMGLKVIYVFSHDSLGVGEDGPTHQPVEQLAALRAIPGLTVIRPADANETVEAWKVALTREGPTALILSRQGLVVLDRDKLAEAEGLSRGAYVIEDCRGNPDVLLLASGSEVFLALCASETLAGEGLEVRTVSMPSWELFEEQEDSYRNDVLPRDAGARVAIEAGISQGWQRYVGDGATVSVERFGTSAPGPVALADAGITVEEIVERAKEILAG